MICQVLFSSCFGKKFLKVLYATNPEGLLYTGGGGRGKVEKIITFNSYEQLIVYLKDNKILFDITIINIDIDKKSINTLVTKYRFKNIIALSSNNKDILMI